MEMSSDYKFPVYVDLIVIDHKCSAYTNALYMKKTLAYA